MTAQRAPRMREHVVAASEALANLTTWGAVIALLEGGLLYGRTTPAKSRVIAVAKREQQKHLTAYDAAMTAATGSAT